MMNIIATLLGTILGSILTWLLTRPRVKLAFSIQQQSDSDDSTPHNMRTKTSDSGYCIYCYNNGDKPFMLDNVCLYHKCSVVTELCISAITIKPYDQYIYTINEQEYDNIRFHCEEENLKECDVYAYDVSGKKHKAKIDLFWPKMQADAENFENEN